MDSKKFVLFCATGGYVGYVGVIPGTFGTLVGFPFCYLLSFAGGAAGAMLLLAFIGFAIFIAHRAESIIGKEDPGCIVIDEIAGLMVTLYGLPFNMFSVILGFFIFRALDIIKPPPVGNLERRLSGGLGIVMDDVAAGILGNLILRFAWIFYSG